MNGPNAHSGKKRVRDFEKSTLASVYADLCFPGDHHQDCPQRPQVCPVTRDEQDRLFVPLKTGPFRAFESGPKEWEVRGVGPRFNLETVHSGRVVELRRGYSTPDSLWGRITDVRTFENVPDIADSIQPHLIKPGADRAALINSVTELIGGYDRFIAFRVDLDGDQDE